jgi:hypothetical protein
MPVIQATQVAEIRRIRFESSLNKNTRSYLKNTLKQKGLGVWLKCRVFV